MNDIVCGGQAQTSTSLYSWDASGVDEGQRGDIAQQAMDEDCAACDG